MEQFNTIYWTAYWTLCLIFLIINFTASWVIFKKAGQKGWKALIPIYSTIILLRIIKKPWWWLLLMLIPIVNIYFAIVVYHRLSKAFGHGAWFTVGLIFFPIIFLIILAFGDSVYLWGDEPQLKPLVDEIPKAEPEQTEQQHEEQDEQKDEQ